VLAYSQILRRNHCFSKKILKKSSMLHYKFCIAKDCQLLCVQGRNEVRWRPGQEASLSTPCSNLRYFGSKCSVLKKVLVTILGLFGAPIVTRRPGNRTALATPRCAPVCMQTHTGKVPLKQKISHASLFYRWLPCSAPLRSSEIHLCK